MNVDEDHLRLLSILHFALGLLYLCVAGAVIIVLLLGSLTMFSGDPDAPPPAAVQAVCIMYVCGLVVPVLLAAACTLCASVCIAVRRWYSFCLIIALLNCGIVPLGTLTGILTIITLGRPSVKTLFAKRQVCVD